MRITGGHLSNRQLNMSSPKGIRPTASRVREAIFSMLGQELDEVRFLDAFGGSGIMGIEAYSRGADVTICEKRKGAFLAIKKTIGKEGWPISVVLGSADKLLNQEWDIIFMDPPYDFDPEPWIKKAQGSVLDILIVEHASRTQTPEQVGTLHKIKSKRYGDCALSFYSSSEV